MKERPILFSGEMVRAILDGRKTQTRRVVKPQPTCCSEVTSIEHHENPKCDNWLAKINGATLGIMQVSCPYGKPGDRLWVKETYSIESGFCGEDPNDDREFSGFHICYRTNLGVKDVPQEADPKKCHEMYDRQRGEWRPSIFMPRWASRITLEIVSIRVERLNDISEEDAKAEGCPYEDEDKTFPCKKAPVGAGYIEDGWDSAKEWYADLWEEINGEDSWDTNPWVWVIEFKRI